MGDVPIDVMSPFVEFNERQLKSGARRVKVNITADGLVFDLSERRMLETIGPALVEAILDDFARITEKASDATLVYREKARRALARGARWAVKRYSGRTEAGLPGDDDTLLHDSGRFENSVTAQVTGTRPLRLTVNVAANRLNPESFTAAAWVALQALVVDLIPSLSQPFEQRGVLEAYEQSVEEILQKSTNDIARARARRNRAWFALARRALQALAG